MATFKVESSNDNGAVLERFTVVAPDLDTALEAARADQRKQWQDEGVRITSIVETNERVITAKRAAAKGASSSD